SRRRVLRVLRARCFGPVVLRNIGVPFGVWVPRRRVPWLDWRRGAAVWSGGLGEAGRALSCTSPCAALVVTRAAPAPAIGVLEHVARRVLVPLRAVRLVDVVVAAVADDVEVVLARRRVP